MTPLEEIKNKLAIEFAYKNGEGDVTPMWLHKADLLECDEHAFIKGFDACLFLMRNYEYVDPNPIGWINKSTREWVNEETIISCINENTKP